MALFKNMSITYKGMALYAKAQAGQSIRFTKMQVGSGQIGTQNPATLVTLLDKKLDVPITSITANPEHKSATIIGIVTNTNVTEALYICEIGIWATDPDEGEILYGYANCGTYGDYYAPASQGPYSWQYEIGAAIGNAANVTAELSQLNWDYGVVNSNTGLIYLKGGNQKEINKSADDEIKKINTKLTEHDTHLGEKANKLTNTITLLASGWTNKAQTISLPTIKATSLLWVTPTPTSIKAYSEAMVYANAQANGTITFICDTVPSSNLSVQVTNGGDV